MVDWVCGSLGGSLIPRLHLATLLRRLELQANLYCADSDSKRISTVQTRAPNESLLCRLGLQTNLYCADSGSKRISTVQTRAPNESLLWKLGLQTNLHFADSGSKRIFTVQTRAPNESLLCRLGLQTNLYCANSGSKQICTVQTRAPNESLLCKLGLQTNLYCADSGSKWISTVQNRAPNKSLLRIIGLQMTSFTQDGSSHTEMHSLHFSIVEGSGDESSIFFYSLWSWQWCGVGSSRTHFLTGMHCFKSAADRFSQHCMKSQTHLKCFCGLLTFSARCFTEFMQSGNHTHMLTQTMTWKHQQTSWSLEI